MVVFFCGSKSIHVCGHPFLTMASILSILGNIQNLRCQQLSHLVCGIRVLHGDCRVAVAHWGNSCGVTQRVAIGNPNNEGWKQWSQLLHFFCRDGEKKFETIQCLITTGTTGFIQRFFQAAHCTPDK